MIPAGLSLAANSHAFGVVCEPAMRYRLRSFGFGVAGSGGLAMKRGSGIRPGAYAVCPLRRISGHALAASPAALSEEDRTKRFRSTSIRGVSTAKNVKEKVDSAKEIKEQTWDQLPEEGQEFVKEATKEGAGKSYGRRPKESKTLGKAAKRAEKVVKPLAKKAAKFVVKKGNPRRQCLTPPGRTCRHLSFDEAYSPRRRACGSGNGSRRTSSIL